MLRQNYKNRDVSQITFKEMAISGLLNSYNESQNAESFLSLVAKKRRRFEGEGGFCEPLLVYRGREPCGKGCGQLRAAPD